MKKELLVVLLLIAAVIFAAGPAMGIETSDSNGLNGFTEQGLFDGPTGWGDIDNMDTSSDLVDIPDGDICEIEESPGPAGVQTDPGFTGEYSTVSTNTDLGSSPDMSVMSDPSDYGLYAGDPNYYDSIEFISTPSGDVQAWFLEDNDQTGLITYGEDSNTITVAQTDTTMQSQGVLGVSNPNQYSPTGSITSWTPNTQGIIFPAISVQSVGSNPYLLSPTTGGPTVAMAVTPTPAFTLPF